MSAGCSGVKEPNFYPRTADYANTVYFPSATPTSGTMFGTLNLYSNDIELTNFYLQAKDDDTEGVVQGYTTYTDGYAARISLAWPTTYTDVNQYNGACISS
jgi:hypothetical protein